MLYAILALMIGFVTDSTSDLPLEIVERFGIQVIPAILIVEGKEYADGVDISREEFYARLPRLRTFPTTAAPSPADFSQRYRQLFEAGYEHVISIHPASQLTALYTIACQAAAEFGNRVTVLDSGSLSMGLGFQVIAAAEAAEAGADLPTLLQILAETRRRLRLIAALDTMEYLRRSGRVSSAITMFGGLLRIKPIIELTEGQVKPLGVARTTQQANHHLADLLKTLLPLDRLAILHSGAEARAHAFFQQLMEEMRRDLPRQVLLVNVTSVIGAHVGPHGLGFTAIRAS